MSSARRITVGLRTVHRATYVIALLLLFAASAEVTARVQDWIVRATPFWAVPDWDRDLFVDTPSGRRGRPNGRYLNWVLNDYGFRTGAMSREPPPGRQRLVVLGSSESFGIYESPGHEFPAILADRLRPDYEVINAALVGLTVCSGRPSWPPPQEEDRCNDLKTVYAATGIAPVHGCTRV